MNRWKVRKWPISPGAGQQWAVFDHSGLCVGSFATWHGAMEWATSISADVERWLAHQPRPWMGGTDYWGRPADRNDDGTLR